MSPDAGSIAAAFLSDDGFTYGVILEATARVGNTTTRSKRVAPVTPLADGRFIATATASELDAAPEFRGEVVRVGTEKLVARHQQVAVSIRESNRRSQIEQDFGI